MCGAAQIYACGVLVSTPASVSLLHVSYDAAPQLELGSQSGVKQHDPFTRLVVALSPE